MAVVEAVGISDTGVYEPTMALLSERRGHTVPIDVIDRWDNTTTGPGVVDDTLSIYLHAPDIH